MGITIFYIFNSLNSQNAMLEFNKNIVEMFNGVETLMNSLSIFVSIILGFLIVYATNFLIKRRKKEFGIYLTLGMNKNDVSKILVLETFLIGIISLISGIVLGIIMSHGMSIITANIFAVKLEEFKFIFSLSATIKTILYFSLIFVVVMLFNTLVISRMKLIDLLNAHKKNEKHKNKNIALIIILFVISITLLATSYYFVVTRSTKLSAIKFGIIGVSLGTLLFFYSISAFIFSIVKLARKKYYSGLNMFIARQFESRVNKTILSSSIICLLIFFTIVILSASTSLADAFNDETNEVSPYDITLTAYYFEDGATKEDSFSNTINKYGINDKLDDYTKINFYYSDLMIEDLIDLEVVEFSMPLRVVKLSEYNKTRNLLGVKEIALDSNEYYFTANFSTYMDDWQNYLNADTKIIIDGNEFIPKNKTIDTMSLVNEYVKANFATIVVNDSYVEGLEIGEYHINGLYSNDYEKEVIEDEIIEIVKSINSLDEQEYIILNSKLDYINSSLFNNMILTYVGLYLGIVFLIACSTIIALIQLSEADENIEKYILLSKIGTNRKDISKSIISSIAIGFFTPLSLAMVHSVFGIWFTSNLLKIFGQLDILNNVIYAALVILIIYGGYFVITCMNVLKSVRKHI